MKINVYEDGMLIKVIPMDYNSSLSIEFSHTDNSGNDRYKVFCDSNEVTFSGFRIIKSKASNAIARIQEAYINGDSHFDIKFGN